MKANAVALTALFERKMRLEVPLFQRQYVWSLEQQWEPLWEDISRKFSEFLSGRLDAPVHFLGAIVLDQKQTPATHVERRMVIDGQQRLTTLQIFMAAFKDFCRASAADALAEECESFTLNKGMMPDPEVDKFKVWPTKLDRQPFIDSVTSGGPESLQKLYPLVYKKYARKPDPRPRIVDAYLFFYRQLDEYFTEMLADSKSDTQQEISVLLEQCFQALKNSLLVVAIDLEPEDDAQVIFETLNARGEPLLPADLLRNYIFLRAARLNEPQEELYKKFWEPFDDDFWRETVSQGRINRPRSDLLMQHYLASKQGIDIPIKHLYAEYRHWIEKMKPFATVRDELISLKNNRENFRNLLTAQKGRPFSSLGSFLSAFDIGTAYPLLLALLSSEIEDEELEKVCNTIESYLLWRAVCGLTNKNLNRVFLSLTRLISRSQPSLDLVSKYLLELRGDSAEWPSVESFYVAWTNADIYHRFSNPKISYVLLRLNDHFSTVKNESVDIVGSLTVEHLMPQQWEENWKLRSGLSGMTFEEMFDSDNEDPRKLETEARERIIHTFGNLTLLTSALNAAASNSAWEVKKAEIVKNTLLPITLDPISQKFWTEDHISDRSNQMFKSALSIWPRAARTA